MSLLDNFDCITLDWPPKAPEWYKQVPGQYATVAEPDRPLVALIKPNIEHGPWIAGGAALSWYTGNAVQDRDIDVWFRDQEQLNKVRSQLIEAKAALIFQSDNAETYQIYAYMGDGNTTMFKVQLITREFFDNASEIVDLFDISVCQMVTDGTVTVVGEHTVEDVASKKLRLLKERPDMLKRIVKYMAYGYSFPPEKLLEYVETQFDFDTNLGEYDVLFLKGDSNGV